MNAMQGGGRRDPQKAQRRRVHSGEAGTHRLSPLPNPANSMLMCWAPQSALLAPLHHYYRRRHSSPHFHHFISVYTLSVTQVDADCVSATTASTSVSVFFDKKSLCRRKKFAKVSCCTAVIVIDTAEQLTRWKTHVKGRLSPVLDGHYFLYYLDLPLPRFNLAMDGAVGIAILYVCVMTTISLLMWAKLQFCFNAGTSADAA